MQTTISLDLSRTGVRLLRGAGSQTTVLGEAAFDDTDFDARIADLRRAAGSSGELRAVVLVPLSEILFTDLAPAEGGDAAQETAIRDALEGMTPYALDDLALAWRRRGDGRIAVAAVARETLEEADAFATAQGFTPVAYGSLPAPAFGGAVDFGAPAKTGAATRAPAPAEAPIAAPDVPVPSGGSVDRATPAMDGPRPSSLHPAQQPPAGPVETRLGPVASRIALLPDSGAGPRSREPAPRPALVVSGATSARGGQAPVPTLREVVPLEPAPEPTPAPLAEAAEDPRDMAEDDRPETAAAAAPAPLRAPLERADSMASVGARPVPPRRAPPSPIVPVAMGLALALAFAAVVWSAILIFGPDRAEQTALDSGPQPVADGDAALPETLPPPSRVAQDRIAASDAPDDPLNRSAGASEADRYAATGVDPAPPLSPDPVSDDSAVALFGDAVDPPPAAQDPLVAMTNPLPEAPARPPVPTPPDSAGATGAPEKGERVEVTPDSTVSRPDIRVTGDRPPVMPPARPGSAGQSGGTEIVVPVNDGDPALRPETRPEAAAQEGTRTDAPPPGGVRRAPAPSGPEPEEDAAIRLPDGTPRPRARPGPAEVASDAAMAPAEEATIAEIAPRPRPEGRAEPETPDPQPLAARAEAAIAAAMTEQAQPAQLETDNPSAVARSLTPANRPSDLGSRAASSAPVQVATAAPPTAAGAAPGATLPNVLALGHVNLIGVYGSDANRRALIRLPSGQFEKVQVGDRIDGGRVRAIGNDALSYVKGGRSITIQIPNG